MAGQWAGAPEAAWETAANSAGLRLPWLSAALRPLAGGGERGSEAWPPPAAWEGTAAAQVRASLADLPQGAGGKSQMENPHLANE